MADIVAPVTGTVWKIETKEGASVAEGDTLRQLYERVVDARRELGQESIPFQKFQTLVQSQVNAFKAKGNSEVAFRVSMKDGKVAFTARAMKRTTKVP